MMEQRPEARSKERRKGREEKADCKRNVNKNKADNSYHRIDSWGTEGGMEQHSVLYEVEELEELVGFRREGKKAHRTTEKQAGGTQRTG